jgi:predicted metal-dependent hydrolase
MSQEIIDQVKNYDGKNSFIIKMKEAVSKYGSLTAKQSIAVQRILTSPVESKSVEMTDDMKKISEYQGENTFVKDIKEKLEKYGKLSEKQVAAALGQIQKEEDSKKVVKMNIPAEGDTIKIRRRIGESLKEKYNLNFNPILLDITKVLGMTPKSVKFAAKLTIKRGSVCTCCMRTLTDEFSMLTGLGKTCAKHLGVTYITDKSEATRFREDYLKRVDEIGEMELWVPKSQIETWEGENDILLSII